MSSKLADQIFRAGVPESKKLELIYRKGASLSADEFKQTIKRLRDDCRYARFLGALIDVSKNGKQARVELFSENAVSVKIVASFKWLYTIEHKSFISEHFVQNTLPATSISSQKQIANKISKWVTNTVLGDKLWLIVHSRCPKLASTLLGACSNDLIMREIGRSGRCLSISQMLHILRKRLDSGIELVKRMVEAEKLNCSAIDKDKIFHYILKQDFEKGVELLIATKSTVRFGRHLTRKLLRSALENESRLSTLLKRVKQVDQKVLARNAPADVYLKCFLARFNEDDQLDARDGSLKLQWLKHLRDDAKLKALETWYETVAGSMLVDSFDKVPKEFLFLLDETTLREVVNRRIDLVSGSEEYSDEELQFWESMIPDDEECFEIQKERLIGGASGRAKQDIYLNMLRSVFILRRPQYLKRRLNFLVRSTRNDRYSQEEVVKLIGGALLKDYRFTLTEEIWPHVKHLINVQLLRKYEEMNEVYRDILLLKLEQVALDQITLLEEIMETLNKVQVVRAHEDYDVKLLSEEKRRFFWNGALAYRESLKDTSAVVNGRVCPKHLQYFYIALARERKETRDLIESYPKTMRILKNIVGPEMSFEKFSDFSIADVRSIHELLEEFLASDEPIFQDLLEQIHAEKVLREFRKSKIATEEVRALYAKECGHKDFIRLCGRSLLHAEFEHFYKWVRTLNVYIEKNENDPGVANTYNLATMISCPARFKLEVALHPTKAQLIVESEWERRLTRQRINVIKSLRHINDSGFAFEMTLNFMMGDYFTHGELLPSFHYHRSRLPAAKMVSVLRKHIMRLDSYFGARKAMLHGLVADASLMDSTEVIFILELLAVKIETDNMKNEVLKVIFTLVKEFGETKCWPALRICLDAIAKNNHACIETLMTDVSIDEHIPAHIEYLMQKVVEFSDAYKEEDYKWPRLVANVEILPLKYLLHMLKEAKCADWSAGGNEKLLAISILQVRKHASELLSHFVTFGQDEVSDLKNFAVFIDEIAHRSIAYEQENVSEFFDTLRIVLKMRSNKHLREMYLLDLTEQILPLLPKKREYADCQLELKAIIRAALNVSTSFMVKSGFGVQRLLEFNLYVVLEALIPEITWDSEWCEYFLDLFDEQMSPEETLTLLRVVDWCEWDKGAFEKLRKLYSKCKDERVIGVVRNKLVVF